ncbi:conserved hypothetical protein [Methylocella tundrae]|uniref:Chromosome segregation ATPase n=2 Tax=Methylocella tundrae TaxID=227605 RepID=A0A8B6LZN0_METTU|nr:conserved hypothetical protein [Methylocella tundrae]
MIEQAMLFALGFLIAGLLALVIAPAFWRRAIRLSTRRLEMLVPLSTREIIAERDLLRAEFAVERRKMEQKAAALNAIRMQDMAELGRRAIQLVEKSHHHAALESRYREQAAELAAARIALAEAQAELAAANSALYGADGLNELKERDLTQLRGEIATAKAQAAKQSAALADFEALVTMQQAHLVAARNDIARLADEFATLRLERDAGAATLKATAAQLADREEALTIAQNREAELLRRRRRQIETSRAVERRLVEKIARLNAADAAARQDLDAARERSDGLAQELAALRRLSSGRETAPASSEREENTILRQNINEIGAAIIRMAGLALDSAPPERFDESSDKAAARALAKAHLAAKSK